MARKPPPKHPGARGPDTLYILLELGETIAGKALEESRRFRETRSLDQICDAALRHLPKILPALAASGLALARREEKQRRGQRRRKIRRSTWEHLEAVAAHYDLTRPQLLRALLRAELDLPPAPPVAPPLSSAASRPAS